MTEDFVLKRLNELCKEKKWSIYRLAKESDISYSTLNNMINRQNTPSFSTLIKLCQGLNISLPDFFSEDNQPTQLTSEEIDLISEWQKMSLDEKKILKAYIKGLLHEK